MARSQADIPTVPVIDPHKYGVSFSIKQCRNFGLDVRATLDWLLYGAGFRRFRLMSYWNEIEKEQGHYDFAQLDQQFNAIEKAGGVISLCLGARQPRWPENHWPDWAWNAPKSKRSTALLTFIEAVVDRYKDSPALVSYQLENEALLKSFGRRPEVDRQRLRQEYQLVREHDPRHPIIMTTSNSWGMPLRSPRPDIIGFSYYHTTYGHGRYTASGHSWRIHKGRSIANRALLRRPSFIHELQLEPWGPTAIWKMPEAEQDKSMSPQHIKHNLLLAKRTGLYPIDMWGAEWWFWRLSKHNDPSIWETVRLSL